MTISYTPSSYYSICLIFNVINALIVLMSDCWYKSCFSCNVWYDNKTDDCTCLLFQNILRYQRLKKYNTTLKSTFGYPFYPNIIRIHILFE